MNLSTSRAPGRAALCLRKPTSNSCSHAAPLAGLCSSHTGPHGREHMAGHVHGRTPPVCGSVRSSLLKQWLDVYSTCNSNFACACKSPTNVGLIRLVSKQAYENHIRYPLFKCQPSCCNSLGNRLCLTESKKCLFTCCRQQKKRTVASSCHTDFLVLLWQTRPPFS